MPKPLRLFVPPPYKAPTEWKLVRSYGPRPAPPGGQREFNSHVELASSGTGTLLAAVSGKLSGRPPLSGTLGNEDVLDPNATDDPLPDAVTLFLHLSPAVTSRSAFRERMRPIGPLLAFEYLRVETAFLVSALGELLDAAVLPAGSLTRDATVRLMVLGMLDVWVPSGHAVGRAAPDGPSARRAGFAVLTDTGPVDPAHTYDWMRDHVDDGQSAVDEFLGLVPKRWPVIDPGIGTPEAIDLTQTAPYSWGALHDLRSSRGLTRMQWRQVGDNQKSLWRNRLLRRVGRAAPSATDPPFEFDDVDRTNLFQLEALVEFYMNFDEPWAERARPVDPTDANYVRVDFLDPAGEAATAAGTIVTLDGAPDLRGVRRNEEVLFLAADANPARPLRCYRIIRVDQVQHTVTVDAAPSLGAGTSAWRISLRPHVVFVDPLGARKLQGRNATASGPSTLTLDAAPDLRRVNADFDTVHLPSDTARASRTYRIVGKDNGAKTVTVDGTPSLDGGSSAWQIPAGVGGELPALTYTLGPNNPPTHLDARGNDHYDAVAFVVHNDAVAAGIRFSTFTSRDNNGDSLSSVRGNRRYDLTSFRSSGSIFRNYCFRVTDAGASYDGIREARYYFTTPVAEDRAYPPANPASGGPGKGLIRVHRGSVMLPNGGTGSDGCLVSPLYYDLRDELIRAYQKDYELLHNGAKHAPVQKLYGLNHEDTKKLYNGTHPQFGGLAAADWNDKIVGTAWVIRPDERPVGPLITNSDFEVDDKGWDFNADGGATATTFGRDTGWAARGAASLRITATTPAGSTAARAGARARTAKNTVQRDRSYTLSARIRVLDAPAQGVVSGITWERADGSAIGTEVTGAAFTGTGDGGIMVSARAPDGAVRATASIAGRSDQPQDTIDFYVDAVFFDIDDIDGA